MNKVYLAFPSNYPENHGASLHKIIMFFKNSKKLKLVADFNWLDGKKSLASDVDMFEKDMMFINKSDFVIAEISYASSGVGFQIAYALTKKKKVLCLYRNELNQNVSKFLKSLSDSQVKIEKYENETIESLLLEYFKLTKSFKLHKFNFIISETIKDYLDWLAKDESQSISKKLRKLIEKNIIEKDDSYQKYLQS